MCLIGRQSFYTFTKNSLIGNLGVSCHITNDETGLYNVSNIDKLVSKSMGSVSITNKEKAVHFMDCEILCKGRYEFFTSPMNLWKKKII